MLTFNYRYRIYPDAIQTETLLEWLEICRGSYNYALREIKDWLGSRKSPINACSIVSEYVIKADCPFPNEVNQLNALPKAKKKFERLKQPPSQVLQQTIKQLHRAWKFFLERGFGFPRFKKVGQFKSLLFPQFNSNPLTGEQIKLPKLGSVLINQHRPLPEGFVVKQVRILRRADLWYAVVTVSSDVNVAQPLPHGHAIGVDVGLEKFLATSDGLKIKPPKFFKKLQSKLALLQRRLSRKTLGSKNYLLALNQVARLHHHIDCTRKNFHYHVAHWLCDQGGMIFVEDLDYRVCAKGMFGKQMLDAGFGQFRELLKYVCFKRGVYLALVDARGTSRECPNCKREWSNDLSIRWHCCDRCGYASDRDVASGEVIRHRGLEEISTQGLTGERKLPGAIELPGANSLGKWCNPFKRNNQECPIVS